jgi:hypothetical protein
VKACGFGADLVDAARQVLPFPPPGFGSQDLADITGPRRSMLRFSTVDINPQRISKKWALSGRQKDRRRRTVECYWMLNVNQLSEKGCLRPGCSSTCRWIVNNEVVSLNLRAEAQRLHLSYTVRVGDGEREDMVETIAIVHLPCRFGGSRAYFICPGPGDGTECGRRVTKLHLSRRYFLCRHCNQLTYASQYEQPWERALRRASKLKQRLGICRDRRAVAR